MFCGDAAIGVNKISHHEVSEMSEKDNIFLINSK